MRGRRIPEIEPQERHFISLTEEQAYTSKAKMNLEFLIDFDSVDEMEIERKGGVLSASTEKHPYGIMGTIQLRPREIIGNKAYSEQTGLSAFDCSKDQVDFYVELEYSRGERKGEWTEPSRESIQVILLTAQDLEAFANEHFPQLGMYGRVRLATEEPLPGDVKKEAFTEAFTTALARDSGFKNAVRIYKAVMDCEREAG